MGRSLPVISQLQKTLQGRQKLVLGILWNRVSDRNDFSRGQIGRYVKRFLHKKISEVFKTSEISVDAD
jgi:hypothetical protein